MTDENKTMSAPPTSTQNWGHFYQGLLIFFFILLSVSWFWGYRLWRETEAQIQAISFGQTQAETENARLALVNEGQQKSLTQFNQRLEGFQAQLPSLANQNTAWVIGEVSYILHLAQFTLRFNQNVPGAIVLLESANQQLSQRNDSPSLALRQAIMDNLIQLKAVPTIALSTILLQLNALANQIKALPDLSSPNATRPSKTKNHPHHHQPGWKKGLARSWEELKQIIVIQYHDEPVSQLPLPQERAYLDLHLAMLLSQAQWAVLHQQGALYQNSLNGAIEWVKNHYVESAMPTQAMLGSLNQLVQQNIEPPLPDLAPLLQQIDSLDSEQQPKEAVK